MRRSAMPPPMRPPVAPAERPLGSASGEAEIDETELEVGVELMPVAAKIPSVVDELGVASSVSSSRSASIVEEAGFLTVDRVVWTAGSMLIELQDRIGQPTSALCWLWSWLLLLLFLFL